MGPHRPPGAPCAAVAIACGLVAFGAAASLRADDSPLYHGRPLVEVLRELQQRGLDLVFSSAVVGPELRVRDEPRATEPRALLDEILAPLGLRAQEGPAGSILVLEAGPATGVLRGVVVSATGGRPVAGASVRLGGTELRAESGPDGSFAIEAVRKGSYEVTIEAPGFLKTTVAGVRVAAGSGAEVIAELRALSSFVTDVVVTPSRRTVLLEEQASRRTISNENAVLVPTIGGDVTRVVELLPGIAVADNSAAFNVRGSVAEDFSLVLDGLELYDPFHLQSFQSPFSLIDSNVVDRIDFFGGGFTADFGDRHGGFVEISTLVPLEPSRGEVEVGTLNSRFSYRAPLAGGSGSWLVSARGWYPQVGANTIEVAGRRDFDPRFADVYAKAAWQLGPRQRISLHGLAAYDRLTFRETGQKTNESADATTRNGYLWLRSLSAWTPALTSETLVSVGRIERLRGGLSVQADALLVEDERTVDFAGVKHHTAWQISDAHVLKAGAEVRRLDARYRYSSEIAGEPVRLDPDGMSLGVYVAHRARVTPRLATELGARWDRQTHTDDDQLSARFNAFWKPAERSEVRLALGRFTQSQRIHELDVEDGETDFRRAEVARQAELSFQHDLVSGLSLRLDGYVRRITDVRPRHENLFEPIELFPETTEDRRRIAPDSARLRGIELLVQGDRGRPFYWWVNYALSAADDVIDGAAVPRSWDQTHAARFLLGYRRAERWAVAFSGSIHTGWPTTPVSAKPLVTPGQPIDYVVVPGDRNSARFASYARLDFKARRSWALRRGRLGLTAEVTNLTNRQNECCVNKFVVVERPGGGADVERVLDSWLGLTPSFSVLWEF